MPVVPTTVAETSPPPSFSSYLAAFGILSVYLFFLQQQPSLLTFNEYSSCVTHSLRDVSTSLSLCRKLLLLPACQFKKKKKKKREIRYVGAVDNFLTATLQKIWSLDCSRPQPPLQFTTIPESGRTSKTSNFANVKEAGKGGGRREMAVKSPAKYSL